MNGQPLTKAALIAWKKALTADHAPATVNSMVAAVNGFLSFMGWCECKIKLLKIQKAIFCDPDKELTRSEYARLVRAAEQKENQRLSLIIQTICATGIRVSELRYITAQAVQTGRAEVSTTRGSGAPSFSRASCADFWKNISGHKKSPPGRCL